VRSDAVHRGTGEACYLGPYAGPAVALPDSRPELEAAPPPSPPRKSIEERLAELDDLHQRGIISDEELKDGRAKAIGDG
jgi:hypothetical protein